MINQEIAHLFEEIADLLEIEGADRFRINSYRRAARALDELPDDLAQLSESGQLQKVPGIGKSTAEKIREYLETGQIAAHAKLRASLPAGLLDMLRIPGLGPKKVGALYHELKIENIEGLEKAVQAGKVAGLTGFGQKSADKILEGIAFLAQSAGRTPLGVADAIASELKERVAGFKGVRRVEIAGSVRRGKETVGDLDLLCEATDGKAAIKAFTTMKDVTGIRAAGETKGSVLVPTGLGTEIQVDLRVVPGESFGAALQYFTGSKEHNVRLRELAIKKGCKLNEYGLFKDDKPLAGEDEEGIYKKLGLAFIPPELREDRGEIESKGKLPELIELDDIRGDLHIHTTASDGRASIEEMARAAKARGYKYLAITDHSHSSVIANGLSADRLESHIEAVRAVDAKIKGLTLLAGAECDILADGSLDYPDKLLARLDWVLASIHGAQGQSRARVTARTIAAMENPHIHAIAHPSGRLLGQRDGMDLDWEKIFEAAARTRTALEVSSAWQRLDLNDLHIRQALEAGCWLCIDTDAHGPEQLDLIRFGVRTARRGWASRDRIVNALPLAGLQKWLTGKGGRK